MSRYHTSYLSIDSALEAKDEYEIYLRTMFIKGTVLTLLPKYSRTEGLLREGDTNMKSLVSHLIPYNGGISNSTTFVNPIGIE